MWLEKRQHYTFLQSDGSSETASVGTLNGFATNNSSGVWKKSQFP